MARGIFDELPLKVVSLIIAVTLFLIVRSDKDAAAGAYVRVVYTLPEDRVLVSEPVTEVRVGVRGPWTRLSRLDERDLDPIRIDLRHHTDSQLHFDETMVKLPVGLRAVSITPSLVQLKFERRLTRSVPVQPLVEGEPAPGYHVARLTAHPAEVRVDGAESVVTLLERVSTRPLRVQGARAPVRGEVALEPPGLYMRLADATSVTVEAEVSPSIVERTFAVLPIRAVGLHRLDGEIDPPTARLILRGPATLVSTITQEQVALHVSAELADTHGPARYLRSITVSGLPAGIAAEVQPDAVQLTTHRRRE